MHHSFHDFRTGSYHKRFQQNHIHMFRTAQLRTFYRTTFRFVRTLGWPDPLLKEAPRILLCGTASPSTTVTFARFVFNYASAAHIDVLDISPDPLIQSRRYLETCRDIDPTHVSFVEGDALRMVFADGCFDWIETDFFIQFFSPEEKATLFQEWYRVLKPGGIVTTRDWLYRRQSFVEHLTARVKNWLIRYTLGPTAHNASLREVEDTLHHANFEAAFLQAEIPAIKKSIPLMNYIVIYKPL